MANNQGPMSCPVDGTALVMSERSGIEIDYCPSCRGVWLDRGELDKIIERSAEDMAPPPTAPRAPVPPQAPQAPHYSDRGYDDGYRHGHRHPKRRKSFLEELFD